MDNPETTPVEADSVTAATDNVTPETQPVETETTSASGTEEAGTVSQPWESDPRFKGKTAEDVWQSYNEAQKLITAQAKQAKVAELIQNKFGVSADELEATITKREEAQREQQIKENPGLAAFQEVENLKQQLAMKEVEEDLGKFIQGRPELANYKDKMKEIGLSIRQDASWDDIADEFFGSAIAQGQQAAYKKIETKINTQATGASTATAPGKLSSEEIEALPVRERIEYLESILK